MAIPNRLPPTDDRAEKAEEERQAGNSFFEARLLRAEQLHRILGGAPA